MSYTTSRDTILRKAQAGVLCVGVYRCWGRFAALSRHKAAPTDGVEHSYNVLIFWPQKIII